MQFTTAAILGIAAQCAPGVAPSTIAAVVHTESKGYQFALNVNGVARQPVRPTSADAASEVARAYIARGYSVDLGLGQINSRNMAALGLSWESVFDPCINIGAAGKVLTDNYQRVISERLPQEALRVALSMYNTGSQTRGFRNGYVSRVLNNAGIVNGVTAVHYSPSPALSAKPDSAELQRTMLADLAAENDGQYSQSAAAEAPPPPWDVFARAAYESRRASKIGGS